MIKNLIRKKIVFAVFFLAFTAGCVSPNSNSRQVSPVVIYESADIPQGYDVIGPVDTRVFIQENEKDIIYGLDDYLNIDGRLSDQAPARFNALLELKKTQYKQMIFARLGEKAKNLGAQAVLSAEFAYIPAYLAPSGKSTIIARGIMVKYKK